MQALKRLGSLRLTAQFRTPLTRRFGTVIGHGGGTGVIVLFGDGEEKMVHGDTFVEEDSWRISD